MKPMSLLALSVAAVALIRPCHGQALSGIRELDIVIERLDEHARECGVSPEGLEAAARIVLSSSKLNVRRELGSGAFLYIRATVIRDGGQCIGDIDMSVRRPVRASPSGEEFVTAVWDRGQLMSYRRDDFGRRATLAVEAYTKEMLGAWLKDN